MRKTVVLTVLLLVGLVATTAASCKPLAKVEAAPTLQAPVGVGNTASTINTDNRAGGDINSEVGVDGATLIGLLQNQTRMLYILLGMETLIILAQIFVGRCRFTCHPIPIPQVEGFRGSNCSKRPALS